MHFIFFKYPHELMQFYILNVFQSIAVTGLWMLKIYHLRPKLAVMFLEYDSIHVIKNNIIDIYIYVCRQIHIYSYFILIV